MRLVFIILFLFSNISYGSDPSKCQLQFVETALDSDKLKAIAREEGAPKNFHNIPNSRLRQAVKEGNKRDITTLLPKITNINEPDSIGYTALHFAIENNDIDTAKILLQQGADSNAHSALVMSPLNLAITYHNKDAIKLLLKYKGDPFLVMDRFGNNSFHFSIYLNYEDMAQELLSHDKRLVNSVNSIGETALHLALSNIYEINYNLVKTLLRSGADVNIQSRRGDSVLDVVQKLVNRNTKEMINHYIETIVPDKSQ